MEELIGFVSGNKNRQKLLALLGSKHQLDAEKLAKNMHIARPSVEKIVDELLEKELIFQDSDMYMLTELGELLEKKVQNI
ncbi:MarR family transcriptional regulator [Methanolobus bombayensis]|jgi:predicted transcriptional regulator|uniref:MarR family transcriptional regulator n=1 Tax=Methanolobus bombayensis TaxID=38023 RepID=UPI001AE12A4E|nr:MarR family transcriptional regulator [Methanolobus bombayensis]MBP1910056.1 putative transcriptional regulator [Methanolobus bombayensis]